MIWIAIIIKNTGFANINYQRQLFWLSDKIRIGNLFIVFGAVRLTASCSDHMDQHRQSVAIWYLVYDIQSEHSYEHSRLVKSKSE